MWPYQHRAGAPNVVLILLPWVGRCATWVPSRHSPQSFRLPRLHMIVGRTGGIFQQCHTTHRWSRESHNLSANAMEPSPFIILRFMPATQFKLADWAEQNAPEFKQASRRFWGKIISGRISGHWQWCKSRCIPFRCQCPRGSRGRSCGSPPRWTKRACRTHKRSGYLLCRRNSPH